MPTSRVTTAKKEKKDKALDEYLEPFRRYGKRHQTRVPKEWPEEEDSWWNGNDPDTF